MDIEKIKQNVNFNKFYTMLIETNNQFNLTSITEESEVYEKHFLDSIVPENEFEKNAKVIDVGTGAGFPSIPLAIVRSDLNITAIDALNKRINFVKSVANELNLTNLQALHSRSEDYAKIAREAFDIATSRAVANLSTLLEWLAPLVKVGGQIICYKGKDCSEEISTAKKAETELGLKLVKQKEYKIGDNNRTIVIYKKIKNTPLKYPRANNKALKSPIK